MAEEPTKLDGRGGTEVGGNLLGTVNYWHGLADKAGASRYL